MSQPVVTLLLGGVVIAVDPEHHILDPGAVTVQADRIVAVGNPETLEARFPDAARIDLRHTVILPGLIDSHGHAGHGLTKGIADGRNWLSAVAEIYFRVSDEEFWRAEGFLSALEHLEFGVTTSLAMTGSSPRIDHPRYAIAAATGYADLGLRHVVALGPPQAPEPWVYRDVERSADVNVDLDGALATTAAVIDRLHGSAAGRITVVVGPSSLVSELVDGRASDYAVRQLRGVVQLAREKGVNIHAHAYAGQVAAAAETVPDALSAQLSLAHCTGLSPEELRIMAETGVSASHGPLTHAYIRQRFPLIEAMDAGVNVAISTDGSGPDRSFDLLAQGRIAAQLQRVHFSDESLLPAGKILEMMTIDAARALGMNAEIGSLEPGKKADIIALNLRSARLSPRLMPLQRVIYAGSGLDVEFVMVDGRVLRRGGSIEGVDVERIIDDAQRAAETTYRRAGQPEYLANHPHVWGHVRY